MNLALLPPDINTYDVEFTIEKDRIRFGLSAIKNVGTSAIESILSARQHGIFKTFSDILERVDLSKVNKKTIESLIKAGAMDKFGSRSALLAVLPDKLDAMHKKQRSRDKGQAGLFDTDNRDTSLKEDVPAIAELESRVLLAFEKEHLGFYLTAHPLSSYEKELRKLHVYPIGDITDENIGRKMMIAGLVVEIKKIFTKAGNNEMAFVKIQDLTGIIECIVFPKTYALSSSIWIPDAIVEIAGRVDKKDDRMTFIVDTVKDIEFTH